MNRDILFRGKRIDNGEWVYGNLIETKEEYSDEIVYAILEKTAEHRCCGEYCDNGWYSVVKDTIGEYTGLIDKNGNKIFEGDIVKCENFIGEVIYSCDGFCLKNIPQSVDKSSWYIFNNCNVIGNIYETQNCLPTKTIKGEA